MNKKKKKNAWQKYIGMACFLVLGGVCGFMIGMYLLDAAEGKPLSEQLFLFAGLVLMMYLAMFVQIVIHEAGHMVFGLLTGYRFCSFRIFSFMWVKEHGKLKFSRFSIAGTGGQCLMAPPDFVPAGEKVSSSNGARGHMQTEQSGGDKDGTIPVMLYNFGGSIMNVAAGLFFAVLYAVCEKPSLLALASQIFAVIGFVFAAVNGIPLRMGPVDNDGYNAFSLRRSHKAQYGFWMQMKVNSQIAQGIRLKDMPDEWFAVPSDEDMKNSIVAVQGVLAANRLMDAMRFAEADQLMEHLLSIDSGIVSLHRHLLTCDRMYIEMIGQNRREVLDSMLTKEQIKLMKSMKNYLPILRNGYVHALFVQQDAAKAERIQVQFEKKAAVYPYSVDADAERELMKLAEKTFHSKK